MTDTGFRLAGADRDRLGRSYLPDGEPVEAVENFYRAAAGMITTPRDMALLLQAVLERDETSKLRPAMRRTLQVMEVPFSSLAVRHGLRIGHAPGATVRQVGARFLVGHNGMIDGFLGSFFYNRRVGWGYAALVNAHPLPKSPSLSRIRDAVIDCFAPGDGQEPKPEIPLEVEALASLVGFYRFQNPRFRLIEPLQGLSEHFWIEAKDGALFRRPLFGEPERLEHTGGLRFRLRHELVGRLVFGRLADGSAFVYEVPNSFLKKASAWPVYLDIAALLSSLVVLLGFLLYATVTLGKGLVGKGPLRRKPEFWLGLAAAVVWVSLFLSLLPLDTSKKATTMNAVTVGVWAITVLFPVLTVAVCGAVARRWWLIRRLDGALWGYGLLAASAVYLTLLLARGNLIALRLWGWN
jgi:hypothetical protein